MFVLPKPVLITLHLCSHYVYRFLGLYAVFVIVDTIFHITPEVSESN
jgi:hypothetical protein